MSDTIAKIRARAAKAAATCPFVSPTTGHRCTLPNRHRGPVHSCEPSPSTAGDVVVLLAEVDRLQLFLDCERGIRAPEGWSKRIRDDAVRWVRDGSQRPGRMCDAVPRRSEDRDRIEWHWWDRDVDLDGDVGVTHAEGREPSALEAIEAADRAAGGWA